MRTIEKSMCAALIRFGEEVDRVTEFFKGIHFRANERGRSPDPGGAVTRAD